MFSPGWAKTFVLALWALSATTTTTTTTTEAFGTPKTNVVSTASATKGKSFMGNKSSSSNNIKFLSKVTRSSLFVSSSASTVEEADKNDDNNDKLFSFSNLRKVSNFASFLCVLDCTILPVITVLLPLLGILNLGASQLEFFHHLGHQLALYFVLPVGGLTTVVNYTGHKKKWITSLAMVGLAMVGVANSHWHHWPIVGGHVPGWIHLIQHGVWHRLVNISGCFFLLSSNYISQQQPGCAHGHACGHDHEHSHSHDHDH